MANGENQTGASAWQATWKCLKNHANEIVSVAAITVMLRVAVFVPVYLCGKFAGKLPAWVGYVLAAAVYIAGVIPMRFWGREKMRRMVFSRHLNHKKKDVYKKWLKTGLLRYGRGMLWGLPFLAGAVYFTVFRARLDVKTFWTPIQSLALIVGQEPNIGTGFTVALVLMLIFGLLFAYGWWRDLPFEYLPVRSLGAVKTMHWSRRILKNYRKEMRKNTAVNIALALPAWIGLGAALVPYVLESVDFSLSPDKMLSQMLRLLRSPLPTRVLVMMGDVVLLLYVPLWILRKTRNTVLIGTLMRENAHSHSSGHESSRREGAAPAVPAVPKTADFPSGKENDESKDAVRKAQDAARMAREAAERAARLAEDAARIAREAAENKQE